MTRYTMTLTNGETRTIDYRVRGMQYAVFAVSTRMDAVPTLHNASGFRGDTTEVYSFAGMSGNEKSATKLALRVAGKTRRGVVVNVTEEN